jgi:DNA modification methylase
MTSDNAIASWAHLDLSKVNSEMLDFGPDFDIDLLGIKDFVIEPAEKFEAQCDEDAVPEVIHPITRRGDVWILGNHRLMCGDSTMIDDVEKLMNGEKADMVFTDPPYGVDYKGINNDSRNGLEDLLDSAFGNYLATSKSGASIYVFHSDRCADIFHLVFRKYFHFSSMIIWNKNSLTMSQTDYQSKHEPCMYGWMNNGTHQFFGDRKQLSVWDVFKERVAGHTTPKPVAVIEKAIINSSKGGDLVTDFFMGSGSTIIACEKNQRKSYGLELDPKYCDVIIKRWEQYAGKKAILELTGQTYEELKAERENG